MELTHFISDMIECLNNKAIETLISTITCVVVALKLEARWEILLKWKVFVFLPYHYRTPLLINNLT
jgi:hypothetical protein